VIICYPVRSEVFQNMIFVSVEALVSVQQRYISFQFLLKLI